MICKGLFSGKITHISVFNAIPIFLDNSHDVTARIYHLYLPHDFWYNTFPQKCRLTKFCRMICKRFRLLNPVADILFFDSSHIFNKAHWLCMQRQNNQIYSQSSFIHRLIGRNLFLFNQDSQFHLQCS